MPNSAMPAISRLVAIGRRMKISDTFMGCGRWSLAVATAGFVVWICTWHAGRQPELPFGDHRLARLQPRSITSS